MITGHSKYESKGMSSNGDKIHHENGYGVFGRRGREVGW
jgi:hypothetical protein